MSKYLELSQRVQFLQTLACTFLPRTAPTDFANRQVMYGLDFTKQKQSAELEASRNAIMEHIRSTPDPLIVIEEYDKLDCPSRAMLRQLVQHPELANGTFSR